MEPLHARNHRLRRQLLLNDLAGTSGSPQQGDSGRCLVRKLNTEFNHVINVPEVQKTMGTLGLILSTGSAKDLDRLLRTKNDKFARLVKDMAYKPE